MKNLLTSIAAAAVCFCAALPAGAVEQLSFNFTPIKSTDWSAEIDGCALYVDGTDGDDVLRVATDDRGVVLVNGTSLSVEGRKGTLTIDDVCAISVWGGPGNDVLIDATGLDIELLGGEGSDVLAWGDIQEVELTNECEEVDLDIVVETSPQPSYFDGKFLTARDLTRDQTYLVEHPCGEATVNTGDHEGWIDLVSTSW